MSCSSPLWCSSMTMSQPPTSCPSTKSCGIVGQPDFADRTWRIRGSGRMLIAPNSAPASRSASTVRWENPQAGASGVPFMKSMTRLLVMAWSIASAISDSDTMFMATSAGGDGLHRQGVDRPVVEHVLHRRIDELVLLDQRQPRELRRTHVRPEVVLGPGRVDDLGGRARQVRLDAAPQLGGGGHSRQASRALTRPRLRLRGYALVAFARSRR